jgi:hypothetical protein
MQMNNPAMFGPICFSGSLEEDWNDYRRTTWCNSKYVFRTQSSLKMNNSFINFLAQVTRRVMWAIAITWRPSSVGNHFNLLLENHWSKWDQTWQDCCSWEEVCFTLGRYVNLCPPLVGHLGFSIGPKSNNTWLAACNDHSRQFSIPSSM